MNKRKLKLNILYFTLVMCLYILISWFDLLVAQAQNENSAVEPGKIYTFTVTTVDGKQQSMSDYKGKVLLIVNTASKCGFSGQIKLLEKLHNAYKDRGFSVLGFPSNNFGGQEPGTNEEICLLYEKRFNVTYPLFAKVNVKGGDMHPLYAYLTQESEIPGPVKFNFNKILIDTEGRVIGRFLTMDGPLSGKIKGAIEKLLPKR